MWTCLYFIQIVKWFVMIYLIVNGYNKMPMLSLVGIKQLAQNYNNIIVLRWLTYKMGLKAF